MKMFEKYFKKKDEKKIEIEPELMKRIMSKKSEPMNKERLIEIRCEECPYNVNECGGVRCPTIDEWQCLQYHFKKKHEQEINELKLKIESLQNLMKPKKRTKEDLKKKIEQFLEEDIE